MYNLYPVPKRQGFARVRSANFIISTAQKRELYAEKDGFGQLASLRGNSTYYPGFSQLLMRSRVFRLIELIMYGGLWHGDDLDIHRKIRKKVKMSAQFTSEKFIRIHGHDFTAVDTVLTLGT
ncbi:hypothetical protein TNCV_1223491 [Trichonephila clavipes]|nr:hypothetical protein TNCV_1223491 [Trichonephila clavipes]